MSEPYEVSSEEAVRVCVDLASGPHTTIHEAMCLAEVIGQRGELLAIMQEMFCEGPVDIAMAGNPIAIKALQDRAFAAIHSATKEQTP